MKRFWIIKKTSLFEKCKNVFLDTRICPAGQKATSVVFSKEWNTVTRPRICSTASPCSQKYLLRPSQKDFSYKCQNIEKSFFFRDFLKIFPTKYFPKIFFQKKYFPEKISKSENFKIFENIFPNQKLSKKFENLGIFKFGKTKYSGKKSFWFSTKFFFAYVEKCQNPLLIPYWNCGRNSFSRFWDLEQDPGICVSQRGASSMVKKYLEHAHQTLRIIQLYHVAVPYRI